jgi:hypothetical protein
MPHQLISDLKEGRYNNFSGAQVEARTTKSGKPFLPCSLATRPNPESQGLGEVEKFPLAGARRKWGQGKVESYQGEPIERPHLYTVDYLRQRADSGEYDLELLCQATPTTARLCGRSCGKWLKPRSARRSGSWSSGSWTATGRSSWSAPPPCAITTPIWAVSWSTPGS